MIDCLWIKDVADHSVLWRHWIKWIICAFSSHSYASTTILSSFIPEYQTHDSIQVFLNIYTKDMHPISRGVIGVGDVSREIW